jgi:hypothetical protein
MPIRRFQLQTWTERELVILTSRSSSQREALAASNPRRPAEPQSGVGQQALT